MKKREALVITAYTGTLLCDFSDYQDFVSEIIGRPIFTHEIAYEEISEELRKKTSKEFLKLLKTWRNNYGTSIWNERRSG